MDIEAFILVGGRSSRFGSDKSVAKIGTERLVDRLSTAVQRALPERPLTFVAAPDQQVSPVRFPVISDLCPGRGPLGGIHAALAYSRSPWIFVLACDLPFVSIDLIEHIVNRAQGEHDVVVPRQPDGRVQPLIGGYRRDTCLPVFERILEDDRSTPPLHRILDQVRCQFVDFQQIEHLKGSAKFFVNINTAADLGSASKLLVPEARG